MLQIIVEEILIVHRGTFSGPLLFMPLSQVYPMVGAPESL